MLIVLCEPLSSSSSKYVWLVYKGRPSRFGIEHRCQQPYAVRNSELRNVTGARMESSGGLLWTQ